MAKKKTQNAFTSKDLYQNRKEAHVLGREWKALCGNVALCLVIQEEGGEVGYIEKTQKYESTYRKANVKSPSEVV